MARIINHPLGELSGKVGAVVFKKTKYGSYLSSVPSGPPPKASALQELQQSKMKAVMHFLTPLRVILKHTFFPLAQRTPTFNVIKSYYLRNAVTPSDVGYRMAYSKCLMSYGDLRIPEEVTANWNPGQPVQVSWNPQVTQAMAQADDVLFAVVYQPEVHQFYFVEHLANREAAQAEFSLPEVWSAYPEFHLWTGYYRPEEQQASLSVYLGVLGD